MGRFAPGTVVRVYQEDWWPFHRLPEALAALGERLGIRVELGWDKAGVGYIDEMWRQMTLSFTSDDPPFDVVCADELLVQQYAAEGRVLALDGFIAHDGYALDDFTPATLDTIRQGGRVYGLPCVNVSNVLIYRADLFERYGVAVPQTMAELTEAAVAVQAAVRRDGQSDFYGFTSRGAPGAGYGVWTVSTCWAPAWGVTWFDEEGRFRVDTPEHREALEHYLDLLWRAAPPEQADMTFVDTMNAYETGRVAMNIEVGMEYAHTYAKDPKLAEVSRCALVPAGPRGTRHPALYCPPYAIPAASKVKEAAWEVAKYLCSPERLLDDALRANAVETSRNSVLNDPRLDAAHRPDLLAAVRGSRPHQRQERPFTRAGLRPMEILGAAYNRALRREIGAAEALAEAQAQLAALGPVRLG